MFGAVKYAYWGQLDDSRSISSFSKLTGSTSSAMLVILHGSVLRVCGNMAWCRATVDEQTLIARRKVPER